MRNLVIAWLHKAVEMETGQEIYLPTDSKQSQKDLVKMFGKELAVLKQIDAVNASKIHVGQAFKDGKLWVVIKKLATSPAVGFQKDSETGTVQRVHVHTDSDRLRRINLMREDGMSIQQVEQLEGELSTEEKRMFV